MRERLQGLRILAACDFFSPDSSGGIERVVEHVCGRLSEWGAEVVVLTAMPRRMRPFQVDDVTVEAAPLSDLSRLAAAQVGLSPAMLALARRALRRHRPHVLLANGIHFQSSLAIALLRPGAVPMVTASHVAGLDFLPQPTRLLTSVYERSLGRLILARSRRVISISQAVTDHLLQLGVDPAVIDDVPNGVDLDLFRPAERRREGPPTVMFVGRHIPNKGPQVLLDALVLLKRDGVPFRGVFLSDGPLRPRLEARARQEGLPVEFRGHVPSVAEAMREADIIARPSFTEGLPLTVLESMAAGVCLVVSDIPGNRDLVVDGENGLLVPAGDAGALTAALRRVIGDQGLRERLVEAGRQTAARFSWDACAEGTAASLLRACG